MAHTRPAPPPPTDTPLRARRAARAPRRLSAALCLGLLVALSTTPGCMVLDELDSAAAKMPTSAKEKAEAAAKKDEAKTAGPSGAAGKIAASKAAVMAASRQWWKQAKTINTGDAPTGVVSCKLPEGMKFMSKDDCVTQGGKPGDASS